MPLLWETDGATNSYGVRDSASFAVGLVCPVGNKYRGAVYGSSGGVIEGLFDTREAARQFV